MCCADDLVGHSVTGYSNESDYLNRYFVGIVQLGKAIQSSDVIDVTPGLLFILKCKH